MLRILTILLLFAVLNPMHTIAAGYNELELKTLFTTPAERQAINAERRGGTSNNGEVIISGPTSIQLDGYVSRSDGSSVVWMNGKNTMDNSMIDGVKIYSDSVNNKSSIPVMVDGRMVYLKPGETWSEESGIVDDSR